jgi:hypothetical protein
MGDLDMRPPFYLHTFSVANVGAIHASYTLKCCMFFCAFSKYYYLQANGPGFYMVNTIFSGVSPLNRIVSPVLEGA